MSELAALTEQLVSIPSHDDETAAGDAITAWLRAETDATGERAALGNAIAYRHGEDADRSVADIASDADRPLLALVGNHDGVPSAEQRTTGEDMEGA